MISDLNNLYSELEHLSERTRAYCTSCERHCCRGYIHLLYDEVEPLLKNDASVLEHTREKCSGYMLDTYPRDEHGNMIRDAFAPICPNRTSHTGRCNVYDCRPLVCRLYPIDIQPIEGDRNPHWVVHKKCDFLNKSSKANIQDWLKAARTVVRNIDNDLLKEIETEWRKIAETLIYPPDFDHYDVHVLGKICTGTTTKHHERG